MKSIHAPKRGRSRAVFVTSLMQTSVAAALLTSVPVFAQTYISTQLGDISPFTGNGNGNVGYALNAGGVVVGVALGYRAQGAVAWSGGVPTLLSSSAWGDSAAALALNNKGQIVGYSLNYKTAVRTPLIWTNGVAATLATQATLPTPGLEISPTGINDHGAIVGNLIDYAYPYSNSQALFWANPSAAPTVLSGLTPTDATAAYGINNSGTIVGESGSQAVVWHNGVPTALPLLPSPYTSAQTYSSSINNAGVVAGYQMNTYIYGEPDWPAIWNGSSVTEPALPTGDTAYASSINDQGQIVGTALPNCGNAGCNPIAVVWNGSTMTDLNQLLSPAQISEGWSLDSGVGINDAGTILADGINHKTGELGGFEFSLVPEPSSSLLMLAGLSCIALGRGRWHAR